MLGGEIPHHVLITPHAHANIIKRQQDYITINN